MINDVIIPAKNTLTLNSVLNFRDIGGAYTSGGQQVREKTIFRSANPDKISREDISILHELDIKTIIDLRAPDETQNRNKRIDQIETVSLPLDFEKITRERLMPYFYKKNSHSIIADISNTIYLEILDASIPVFKQLVEILLSPGRSPVLIHCQAGKDRTGVICALIHMALETERHFIIEDYLTSNDSLLPYYKRKLTARKVLSLGFFPSETVLYAIKVRQRNIESVIDRVNEHYGGIESYLGLSGFNMGHFDSFRERLLAD